MKQLNAPVMYLLCGGIVLTVAVVCVVFLVRAYRAGIAIGMEKTKLRRVIVASASFTALPSIGILLGVIALSGSLGVPWSWLRLSVIGALHYETQVAQAAAEAVGLSGLSASQMTLKAFSTICLLMSACIIWIILFCLFFGKRYSDRLRAPKAQGEKRALNSGFGDLAMTAMFIGLVSTYLGSYVGGFIKAPENWLPLAVAAVGCLAMAGFVWLYEKKGCAWAESLSVAGSMLIAMAAAVVLHLLV